MASINSLATNYGLPASHLEVLDFQRQPSWRLEEAETLRRRLEDNPYVKARHRDPLVTRLGQFLFRWHNVIGDTPGERSYNRNRYLSSKYADLLWTFPIASFSEDNPARLEIEARLLAGQPTDQIAAKLQVPQRMIDIYQSCFYEVTHRLPNKAYIHSHCLMNGAATIEAQPKDFVVRMFAYFGGIHVMEPFLYEYPTSLAVPSSPVQLRDYFKEVFRITLARRGMFMATFFNPSRFNISDMVSTVRQMHQIDEEATIAGGAGGGGSMSGADVVHSLVETIEWCHGIEGRKKAIESYGPIIDSPRQLSLEEKVKLRLGETLENQGEIEKWEFPLPTKQIQTHEAKVVEKDSE